ncbi:MAG: hypothetical protein B7Z55_15840, partial [Planctomycetales bacterium 12-60-4]
ISIMPSLAESRSALRFDMESKASSELHVPGLHLPTTGPLTIEGYVKIESSINSGPSPEFFGTHIQIGIGPNGLTWYPVGPVAEGQKFPKPQQIPLRGWRRDTWQHVAAVRDGQEHRLYVDGVLHGAAPAVEPLFDLEKHEVGKFFIGSLCKGVLIREVRVSSVARYSKAFTPAVRFEPDSETMALYHFDEGSGDLVHDVSANGHDARLSNVGEKWVQAD